MANNSTGNRPVTDFFANATKNRLALVPGAAALTSFSNKGQLGEGTATSFNSRVRGSQQNGSGPAVPPTTSPFSFTQFATGARTLVLKRIGK
jgi:hypothetical protein